MTHRDTDPVAVLAEALAKRYVPLGGVAPFTTDAQAILAAMPDYTLVRTADLERLETALIEARAVLAALIESEGAS